MKKPYFLKLKWSCKLNKILIRKQLLEKRQAIPTTQRAEAANAALQLLIHHPIFLTSQKIGCYLAKDDEFDCTPLIQHIWQTEKNCYLPILSLTKEKFLDFGHYKINDPLAPNKYRILEPKNATHISAEELDLVCVPLVGFDLQGFRIGLGGGYYDRTFEFLLKQKRKKPFLLGLGFVTQQVPELPHDEWDVPLNGMLTEETLIILPHSR